MDPTVTLAKIRRAVNEDDYEQASYLFDCLDSWIITGGFLPAQWKKAQDARMDGQVGYSQP